MALSSLSSRRTRGWWGMGGNIQSKRMTRIRIFFLGLGALFVMTLLYIVNYNHISACMYWSGSSYTVPINYCGAIIFALLPMLLLIILTPIFFLFKDEVFHAWLHFSSWWLPMMIGIMLILYLNGNSSSLGIASAVNASFMLLGIATLLLLYIVISFSIILKGYFRSRSSAKTK